MKRLFQLIRFDLRVLRNKIHRILFNLHHWLTDDDDRNTYAVCFVIFVAAAGLCAMQKFNKPEEPQVLAWSALEWS